MKKANVILFGGSFDPIHNGHLGVARVVVEKLSAEALIFIPAYRSPHKGHTPASGHHRLAMIQAAIAGCEKFTASDCELHRDDPSYTLETIYYFREKYGCDTTLFWLIGADQLEEFDKWYKVTELLDICRVSVMHRAGFPPPDFDRFQGVFSEAQIADLERNVVQTPLIDISSTDIRRRLESGDLCVDVLPEPVVNYIQTCHLYGYTS